MPRQKRVTDNDGQQGGGTGGGGEGSAQSFTRTVNRPPMLRNREEHTVGGGVETVERASEA